MLELLTSLVYWYRANKVQAKETIYMVSAILMFAIGMYMFFIASHIQYTQVNP